MDRVSVPELLKDLSRFFTSNGFQIYLVGGAVRDMFLNKEADDWDVATDATPEQVASIFKRIIPTGIEHGTVTIPFREKMIECTTFRTETGFSDGRRPNSVAFNCTIEEDLSRRDFTMNAIAVSLPDGIIIDPFNGIKAIREGVIQTVGNANERFAEDGLRPLRAVRFASQLGFIIERETLSAIRPALPVTERVARERIRDEVIKILISASPSKGLRFMENTGLLALVLPELAACRGIEQKGQHQFDVLDHLLLCCDFCQNENIELRLASLFHDIGKPRVRVLDAKGIYTFHNHETVSAQMTEAILVRLRFPLKVIKCVCHLIQQHMFHYETSWTDAAVRRFIVRVGEDSIDLLFALRRADAYGISGISTEPALLSEFRERITESLSQNHAFSLKDLAINGKDLIRAGIKSGPITGFLLNTLFDAVLEDPLLNTKEQLMEMAEKLYTESKKIS